MKEKKLVSVSVYYKNDTVVGFGCTMTPDMYQAIDEQCEQVWKEFRNECANDDQVAGLLINQLNAIVKRKPLTQAQQCLAIMNVLILADHGYLPNDEYNGVQFCYAQANVADMLTSALFE